MLFKDKNIKSICTENKISVVVPVPAKIVAEMTGGSESMVKKVREGKRKDGKLCQKIRVADQLLQVGITATINQVTEIINQDEVQR